MGSTHDSDGDRLILHEQHDLRTVPLPAVGGVLAPLTRAFRGWLLRLLEPVLARQSTLNAAVTRLEAAAEHRARAVAEDLHEGREFRGGMEARLSALVGDLQRDFYKVVNDGLDATRDEVVKGLRAELNRLGEQVRRQETAIHQEVSQLRGQQVAMLDGAIQHLRDGLQDLLVRRQEAAHRLREETLAALRTLRADLETALDNQRADLETALDNQRADLDAVRRQTGCAGLVDMDGMFVEFDDQFRGDREDIKNRLRVYLPYVKESRPARGKMGVDLGAGRGEWLELLRDEGYWAQGVELNAALVEQCRKAGLDIVESDALAHLAKMPGESVDVVTAFHLVEHIPLEALVKLLDETVRVLRPGGLAILETPNPANLLVGATTFYTDPTHRNPIPPETLRFLAESRGLQGLEILPLHPNRHDEPLKGPDSQRLNQLLFGPQDYALIGRKV